jgi:ferrous iron transport protein A
MIKEGEFMVLSKAKIGFKGNVERIEGKDKIKKFLFSLGCYEGEEITLISILAGNYVVNIKDSRYAIDEAMAKNIILAEQ